MTFNNHVAAVFSNSEDQSFVSLNVSRLMMGELKLNLVFDDKKELSFISVYSSTDESNWNLQRA